MLISVVNSTDTKDACCPVAEAEFPEPFVSGLEYGAPARGTWNIVHTGMLIPGSHQIYVCAANCLRGVILTAAEMNALDRFSTVTIEESNFVDGDMEDLLIDGVADVLERLPELPKAVLIFTSCMHHFIGCDLPYCYSVLQERFPETTFTDCYMNPVMRKSGLNPDQLMRRQLYSLLEKKPLDPKSINIIGNDLETLESSDLRQLIAKSDFTLRDITMCETWEEYQDMAKASVNISYNPGAAAGGDHLQETLGQEHLRLPISFNGEEIRENMQILADRLGVEYDGDPELEKKSEEALARAKKVIGDMPIVIDYTATFRPLSLARMLLEHGFNVTRVYADGYCGDDEKDFLWLQKNHPELMLYATLHVKMRVLKRSTEGPVLAIGQKAAYFVGTKKFVNIVECGGLYGFDGIAQMAELMIDACENEKDPADYIQQKGWGCESCI